MIPTFLTTYIHKDICCFDRRIYNIPDETTHDTNTYLYEIHYRTDLIKIFEMGNAIDTNVFHLFVFMLARLYFIDNGISDVFFYYPKSNNYLIETAFKLLDKRFIRLIDKYDNYEYVEFPGCSWYYDHVEDDWLFPYLKNLYKPIWENIKMEKNKRIYISRKGATTREVLNEDALRDPLKILGFSSYNVENRSFKDQIIIYNNKTYIRDYYGE